MLHLSLIQLPRTALRWRFMRSYELHQMLWKGFPGLKRGEAEERFLYRHEEHDDRHSVLLQSVVRPDWSFLEDEAEGSVAEIRAFDPAAIDRGGRLRFLLRANPVVLRKYPDGKSRHIVVGSRMDLVAERLGVPLESLPSREELQLAWMERKAHDGGFELIGCVPGASHDYLFQKPKERRGTNETGSITFTGVDFEGILRVVDPEKFAETVQRGIGRARGFGFGLLSLQRL